MSKGCRVTNNVAGVEWPCDDRGAGFPVVAPADRQTDRQTERQRSRQTDGWTDRDRKTDHHSMTITLSGILP